MRNHQSALIASLIALYLSCAGESAAQHPPEIEQMPVMPALLPETATVGNLSSDNTIGDLLQHRALQGFAAHLLPWTGQTYDRTMPLSQLGQLLPYHSEVRTAAVLDGINRIIADSRAGMPVFHRIYSPAERSADPALDAVGLFFVAGTPGAPFAIIAPGGGFAYVGSIHEGFPYAQEITAKGMNAFVLVYRTGQGGQIATQDLARAIDYVMENATSLSVSTKDYSLWGSSAGARMAAHIGSHGPQAFGARTTQRPAAVVMAYTSHSDVGTDEPPTFAIVGDQDAIAPASAMENRVQKLRKMGVKADFRVLPGLGHGFGTGAGTHAEGWIGDAADFWQAQRRT